MTLKTLTLIFVVLLVMQFLVICIVTVMNRQYLDRWSATEYSRAIAFLVKDRPVAGWTIRLCYLASVVELLVLLAAQQLNLFP